MSPTPTLNIYLFEGPIQLKLCKERNSDKPFLTYLAVSVLFSDLVYAHNPLNKISP
jgi:hypothetical protein